MLAIISFLAGKKTYIVATVAAVDAFGAQFGWWEPSHIREILEGLLGVLFLRAGIEKSGPVTPSPVVK